MLTVFRKCRTKLIVFRHFLLGEFPLGHNILGVISILSMNPRFWIEITISITQRLHQCRKIGSKRNVIAVMEPHQLEALIPVSKRRVPDRMNERIMVVNGFNIVKIRITQINSRITGHFDRGTGSCMEQFGVALSQPTVRTLVAVPSKIFLTILGSFVSVPVLQKDIEDFVMRFLSRTIPAYTDTVTHLRKISFITNQ